MKRFLPPHKARVEFVDGSYYARQNGGQLWLIPGNPPLENGETILITVPNPKDISCLFVRKAPELAN